MLNIKDHIRGGEVQHVTEWHVKTLQGLGFVEREHKRINTPSMRYGRNGDKRLSNESVILFTLEEKIMTPEQKQEIERLAGDNSQLSDYSRDALRALLEDCRRAEGLVEYWHDERDKLYPCLMQLL